MHAREAEDFGFYRSGFGDGVNKIMLDFIEKHKLLVTAKRLDLNQCPYPPGYVITKLN